ncbi:MAG: TonB family protein [Xenococcaceae cyanobacterium]
MIHTLTAKLLQPTSIAIFASIGIHTLLGVSLPNLPLFSQGEKSTRGHTVRLIELNPVEQTRLPDFSQSLPNIPQFPNTPLIDTPLLNRSPFNTALLSPTQPLPQPSSPPLTNRNNSFTPPIFRNLPPPPLPSPVSLPSPPPTRVNSPPLRRNSPIARPRPSFSPLSPPISPRELINPPKFRYSRTPEWIHPPLPQQEIPANSRKRPTPNPITSPTAPDTVAHRQPNLLPETFQRLESLQEEKTNTTDNEANRNYLGWLGEDRIEEKPEERSIIGTYPKDACQRRLEGTTVYGVWVNAQGQVTNSKLIKSAGYAIFNQQALHDINSSSFDNQTSKRKPYLVKINFEYDAEICPSVTIPPQGVAEDIGTIEPTIKFTNDPDNPVVETPNNPPTPKSDNPDSDNPVVETPNNPPAPKSDNPDSDNPVVETPNNPPTPESNSPDSDNPVVETPNNPVTPESYNPDSDNPVVETPNNPPTPESNNPDSDNPVVETPNNPPTPESNNPDSDNPVVETPNNLPTPESNNPESDNPVVETSKNPVTSESDNPESDNPVVETSNNPVTPKSDNPVVENPNNPVTSESDNPVVETPQKLSNTQ